MNSKKIITIAASVVVAIALIVGGVLFNRSSSIDKKMDDFESTINLLKDLQLQYSTGSYDDVYKRLLDECDRCLADKDTENISALTDRINELKSKIISESKKIEEFKSQLSSFQNALSLYVFTDANKTEFNRLITELKAAIDKSDLKACNTLSERLTTLLSKLKTLSEQAATNASNAEKKYKEDSDFICPDSSTRYLTDSDLCCLTKSQLRLARNEIFARHGRKYKTADLNAYFSSKSWYYGYLSEEEFDDSCISDIEKYNVALIQKYEANFN